MDTGTKEIAEKLADLLGQKIGSRPHLVIMEVHRSQIDANREVREACMHCEACEKVYKDYHSKVCQSKWSDGACAHKSVRSKKRAPKKACAHKYYATCPQRFARRTSVTPF